MDSRVEITTMCHSSARRLAALATLATLVSLTSCSRSDKSGAEITGPDAPLPPAPLPPVVRAGENVQTDLLSYTAVHRFGEGSYKTYGFRVVTQFTNRRATPVYLANCTPERTTPSFGVILAVGTNDTVGYGSIFNAVWACVGHDRQIEVLPGATRTDTLDLVGPNAFSGTTGQPFGTFDGRLRLGFFVQSCRGEGACRLLLNEGFSNMFDVRVER